jgi:ATP-dependent RNA helicase DeaD
VPYFNDIIHRMTFKELGLRDEILNALTDLGFENPTPIQTQAIPQLLTTKSDLVGLAQTGTGKTAAFGLPMIQQTDFNKSVVQALVVAPTRELCVQISEDFKRYTKYLKNAQIATIYGGASMEKQAREIKSGAQIVVATPGRLIDMLERRLLKINEVAIVVLDEADEMLNMGFKEAIDQILESTPETKNVWLFSATMPKEVSKIASNYMSNPLEITVGNKNEGNANIRHDYYVVRDRDRYHALKRVLDYNPSIYGLIFCRTKRETQEVADGLMRDGYNAEPLHGDLTQMQRDKVMAKFRDKTLQILVATDVAARGIDVDQITHVINYNLPEDIENYTHRSGRTGRAGNHGVSCSFVSPKEVYKIKQVEKQLRTNFNHEVVPTGEDICRVQLFAMIDNIKATQVREDQIAEYIPTIMGLFEDFSKEQLIKSFVSAEFNRFLEYYQRAGDLNADPKDKDSGRRGEREFNSDRGGRESRGFSRETQSDKQRFFLNMGEAAGINKGAIVRIVCNNSGIPSSEVGRIDIFKEFSFFDVSKELADKVLDGMRSADYNGKSMHVELSNKAGAPGGGGGDRGRSKGGEKRSFGSGEKRSFGGEKRSFGGGDKRSSGGSDRPRNTYGDGGRERRKRK